MTKTATAANSSSKKWDHAARLVEESFVFNATEATVSHVDGGIRMNFTGLEPLQESMIDDWHKQGYNAILVPQPFLDFSNMGPVANPMQEALHVFGRWNTFVADHADDMMLLTRKDSFDKAQKSGRIGFLVGTHNASAIFRTLDDINFFYSEVGLRHALLTCFAQSRIGTATDEGDDRDAGLSRFGRAVVERMNSIGMAVDVSHCGLKTRRETMDASSRPVLITHGNAAAICPSSRNNSDEMLKALAATGGVIGLMYWRPMVRPQDPVTVEHVIDHFDHVCQLIGPRHVGLGLETPMIGFDPCNNVKGVTGQVSYLNRERSMDIPELCGHDRVRVLVEGLIRRGYSDQDISGILGGNFVRAFKEIFVA